MTKVASEARQWLSDPVSRSADTDAPRRLWPLGSLLVLAAAWLWLTLCIWPQWSFYESYQYGMFVPVLVLALLWKRYPSAPTPETPRTLFWPAFLIVLGAIPLLPARLINEASNLWPTISWPLGLGVVAITLGCLYWMGGRAWVLHFYFPVLFVLSALPWPRSIELKVIQPLTLLNARITVEALLLCNQPALQMGSTIQLASQQVGVEEACSGIRSFHSSIMMALLLSELYRLRAWSRFGLVGAGLVLAFVCNVGRTFALSTIAASRGLEGMERWHDPLGVAVAVACIAGIWALTLILRSRGTHAVPPVGRPDTRAAERPRPLPAALSFAILVWILFVEGATATWFGFREAKMTTSPVWSVELPNESSLRQDSGQYKSLQRTYMADELRSANWTDPDGSHWESYYLSWKHGSKTAQAARGHWPEICMPNAGKSLLAPPVVKHFNVHGLPLPFRTYVFGDTAKPIYLFHLVWEERSSPTRNLDLAIKQSFASRIQAAWDGKRNLGQQLLEVVIGGFEDPEKVEAAFKARLEKMIKVKS